MKGPSLFEGYLGDPLTKAGRSTPDGYFLSGDMGRWTSDGFVKVVGRKKDMIIRGGLNIDPIEVEELIRTNEVVRDVAVVGYADEKYGERACAFRSEPARPSPSPIWGRSWRGAACPRTSCPNGWSAWTTSPDHPTGRS